MSQIWVTDPERFQQSFWPCLPQAGQVSPRSVMSTRWHRENLGGWHSGVSHLCLCVC